MPTRWFSGLRGWCPSLLQLSLGVLLATTILTIHAVPLRAEEEARAVPPAKPYGLAKYVQIWPEKSGKRRPDAVIRPPSYSVPYRIPHTQIRLDLRYGAFIEPSDMIVLLTVAREDIIYLIGDNRDDERVPDAEYDYITEEKVALSIYSPPMVPPERRLTFPMLKIILDGLFELLVIRQRYQQVTFRITDGPGEEFVGYGHIIQEK
ncbi:MAG: hypothetical protein L6R40_002366 [Gallowayella cf. fulva]|nr:MAG: hypothetical protein L6R40_002366 [Xanthomendoza cf. fulva]